ncbi:MAG: UDP-N-acetylglucosamine--N-acetylmuramyl-(pentapeptide) pyrophosphoryl-undecaprenol N-acetylglucosamine transferase [Patescibacteria group bacterium]|nr:UDP-N-acetylglucosamine--N-acetylmuramyl-(pentapeptide) pyrophosphoryl-undecaprenol N-acetylglucosamine transferase [Patescibacteria group bacterium]
MTIIFTGGGTAGHIFPIIAICREIRKIRSGDKNLRLFYIGTGDAYSLNLLAQEGVKIKKIFAGKLRRYFSFRNFLDLFKIPIGILQSFFWLFFLTPDLVFSKGGYGSFPAAFSARILHIPIFLHESDVSPGLASRIESRWALEIFTSFESTEYFPKEKMLWVGNPIRKEILQASKETAKEIFKLQGGRPLILILGGSQGSRRINNLILEILPEIILNFEIVLQTGQKNYKEVEAESKALIGKNLIKYYHPLPFLNEIQLKSILSACDLVVSRAGAGAIFEIAAFGKPSLLIPIKDSPQDHQIKNAYCFAKSGGGEVIEEENLKPYFFLERLKYFFSRRDILEKMREGSLSFARQKAGEVIASYLLEYLIAMKQK